MTVLFNTDWRQCNMLPVLWLYNDPLTTDCACQFAWLVWSLTFTSNEYLV